MDFREAYELRKKTLASADIAEVKAAFEKFAMEWLHTSLDRDYYMCKLNGDWPEAEVKLAHRGKENQAQP